MRFAAWAAGIAIVVVAFGYAALELSPRPAALFYGLFMNLGGRSLNAALERHVPSGVTAMLDQQYLPEAALDVYHPAEATGPLPVIVWMHGGAFFSGSRKHVANYLKILAGRGYVTVAVGYSLAPDSGYPTPLRQANAALAYLVRHSQRLRIDPQRFYLAGDSAGAQIAAQVANIISVPSYAQAVGIAPPIKRTQLRGAILHCGVYDLSLSSTDGLYGHFMRTAIWAYSGRKDAAVLREFSVTRFVTKDFPPTFISAGNADPLLPHSVALAEALAKQGVKVDTLFFPDDYKPALPHEYQFDLDTEAGRFARDRTVKFLATS